MKQESTRDLYNYWNERRGQRAAPERGEIEPGAIRHVLADTFILAFDQHAGHPFRVAGTRPCAAFGRELKGEAFLGLWSRDTRQATRDLINVVAQEVIGTVAAVRGVNADGEGLDFELLVLPLSLGGRTDVRVLGALAPTEVPRWFGTKLLLRLTLGTMRYLAPAVAAGISLPRVPATPGRRLRHGLVVYDGGQV
jgi:hypothetical protein